MFDSYSIKCKTGKWKKQQQKSGWMGQRQGLNGTAFFSATAECCSLKFKTITGKKEIPFSFRSAIS